MSGQINSTPVVLYPTSQLRSWAGGVRRRSLSFCLVSLMLVILAVNANDFAGSAKMTDVRPGDGVWAAVTRYPVECAKGLVGGFNHH